MSGDDAVCGGSTRRDTIRYGGTLVGGGLLAGCTSGADPEATPESSDDGGAAHSVTMEPVGTVEFDDVPRKWVPYTGDYADMGVALGQGDGLLGIGVRARFGSHLYEELPGVSVDADDLTELWNEGTGKEVFYELDADVHLVDPNFVINRLAWSEGDVAEIAENVAPFVGNTGFTRVYDWHDYRYYSMYETLEILADLFDERDRFDAFANLHDAVLEDVRDRLPATSPDVAVLYPVDIPPESFYPYLVGDGTQSKQYRDLAVSDSLAKNDVTDSQIDGGTIDFETLLEIDPDAIAIRIQGEISDAYFDREIRSYLEDHDVASQLTAVENGRVFYGGLTYQGPIIHLFQLERSARGLYPDEFDTDEPLFDREAVADIINGAGRE